MDAGYGPTYRVGGQGDLSRGSRVARVLAIHASKEVTMSGASKKPTKKDLSKAGRDLRNPRTPEKKETEAAKTLRRGRKNT